MRVDLESSGSGVLTVTVSDEVTSIIKIYYFDAPWRNFFVRRWVKSAKKTLSYINGTSNSE